MPLRNNNYRFASLFHFRQNMGGKDNGVVTGKALNQIARFQNLLWIQTGSRLVQNQNFWIVDNRLCQSDALFVAL